MQSTTITTSSGSELKIQHAKFGDVLALQNAILKEIGKGGSSVDIKDFKSLKELDVSAIAPLVCGLMSSEDVQACVFKCLGVCTYNKAKINANTFDDSLEAREDYMEIVFNCVKVNLSPFVKSLRSQLEEVFKKLKESQEQK